MVWIERVIEESVNIRTFIFTDPLSEGAKPGQFVMVWLPGIGEFPMSLSLNYPGRKSSIVVKAMGAGSRILFDARKGEQYWAFGGLSEPHSKFLAQRARILLGGRRHRYRPYNFSCRVFERTKEKLIRSIHSVGR